LNLDPSSDQFGVFVNGKKVGVDYIIRVGDEVVILPVIRGGSQGNIKIKYNWKIICKNKVQNFIDNIILELRHLQLIKSTGKGHSELSTKVLQKNYRDAVRDRIRKIRFGMDLSEINDWYNLIETFILSSGATQANLNGLNRIKTIFNEYKSFVNAEPWNCKILKLKGRIHPRSLLIEIIRNILPKVLGYPISDVSLSKLLFGSSSYLNSIFLHEIKKNEEGRINPGILFELIYRVSHWELSDFKQIEGLDKFTVNDLQSVQIKLKEVLKRFIYLNLFSVDYIRYGITNLGFKVDYFKPELDLFISLYSACRSQKKPNIVQMLKNKGDFEYLTNYELTVILGDNTNLYDRVRDGYYFYANSLRRISKGLSRLLPQSYKGNDFNAYKWYFAAKLEIKDYIKKREINLFPESTSHRAPYHPDFFKDEIVRNQVWKMLINQLGNELLVYKNNRLDGSVISDIEVIYNDKTDNYEIKSNFERHHIFFIKSFLETKFLALTGSGHNTRISHPNRLIGGVDYNFMAMANWHYKKLTKRLTYSDHLASDDLPKHWSKDIKAEYLNRWNYLKQYGEFNFIQKYYPQFFDYFFRSKSFFAFDHSY
jgi:hypothetical protein